MKFRGRLEVALVRAEALPPTRDCSGTKRPRYSHIVVGDHEGELLRNSNSLPCALQQGGDRLNEQAGGKVRGRVGERVLRRNSSARAGILELTTMVH